ncbi:MAG TPA: C25 family cysteine peptidase, partial [Candidatus Krumholzibacteria bacterium]|nr:C25 family cysteine peptidase [Candidatus Krumholzibacteria bacterium]
FRLPIKGIEPRHTLQAEDLCGSYIPASVDVQKIYAVDYPFPPGSGMKPAVRSAINSALSAGTTMFYYVGHGAEDNLADEQIFRSFDIASLANGMKRFVFLAFSCDVGVFDSLVLRSMAEQFVAAEAGGAIAAICASQVSFVTSNELFSDAFYGMLFPSRQSVADQSLGRSLEQAKGVMNSLATRTNSQRYNLFGDPATVLPHPLGGLPFAAASLDTLSTGRRHTAVIGAGDVGAGDAYDLMVSDSMQDAVFTCYDYYTDPSSGDLVFHNPTDYPWVRPGATVFRGNGTAGGAGLSVPFKAPLQLDYGDRGRVRMVVQDGDRGRAAVQAVPVVSGGTGVTDDLRGPEITLGFEDGRYRVQPGTQLEASLADTSGIAMLGTSPGNSILLEFDDTGFMTNVTGGFAYDPDSYTAGRLAFGLPSDLEAGRHTVALYAADALGNVGSDTLGFELVPAGLADIASVTLFPNPTSGPCRLIFELSEPMTVRWDIYTVGGRLVRSIQQPFPSAGPRIIEWDGRDTEGDAIANGTYLFVLRGVDAGRDGRDITRTGKLVVMR